MATIIVQGQKIKVPDEMRGWDRAQQDAYVSQIVADPRFQERIKAPKTNLVEQIGSGVSEGVGAALDFPGNMVRKGMDAIGLPIPANPKIMGVEIPIVGGDSAFSNMTEPLVSDVQPETSGQRIGRRVGQDVGAGAVTAPLGGIGSVGGLATNTAANVAGGLAGGVTSEFTDSPWMNLAATLLGNFGGLATGNAVQKASATNKAIADVPSVDALKAKATGMYEASDATGKTAAGANTQSIFERTKAIAAEKELLDPAGAVSDSYPEIKDVIKTLGKYSEHEMSSAKMRVVRETLQAAAQSQKPREARIGTQMLKQYDEWVHNFAPDVKDANAVYAKAMRGKEIEDTVKIAGTRREPLQRALVNDFSNLQRKGIRGDLTMPPSAMSEIDNVAGNGSLAQKALSLGGQLGPRRLLGGSVGGSMLGGGLMMGNPLAAAGTAGVTAGSGALMQAIANHLAKNAAGKAGAVARNGGPLAVKETDAVRQMIAALLARGAGAPGERSQQQGPQ